MSIVAVVSGAFCSGGEISKQVAKRLGYKWEREPFIHESARKFDATAAKLARTMTGDRTLLNALTREYEKDVAYLKTTMAEMLAGDDIVRQGPATHLIPSTVSHVLKVGIIADDEKARPAGRTGPDPGRTAIGKSGRCRPADLQGH